MTQLNHIRRALADFRIGVDTQEPRRICLELATADLYTIGEGEQPEPGSIEITSELFKRYGKVSMETIKNYCNNEIYNSALIIDRHNGNNPIFTKEIVIDGFYFGFDDGEPELDTIHIGKIGDRIVNKYLDNRGEFVYNNDTFINILTNNVATSTARLFLLTNNAIQICFVKLN